MVYRAHTQWTVSLCPVEAELRIWLAVEEEPSLNLSLPQVGGGKEMPTLCLSF